MGRRVPLRANDLPQAPVDCRSIGGNSFLYIIQPAKLKNQLNPTNYKNAAQTTSVRAHSVPLLQA